MNAAAATERQVIVVAAAVAAAAAVYTSPRNPPYASKSSIWTEVQQRDNHSINNSSSNEVVARGTATATATATTATATTTAVMRDRPTTADRNNQVINDVGSQQRPRRPRTRPRR